MPTPTTNSQTLIQTSTSSYPTQNKDLPKLFRDIGDMLHGPHLRETLEGTRANLDEAKAILRKTQSELNVERKVNEVAKEKLNVLEEKKGKWKHESQTKDQALNIANEQIQILRGQSEAHNNDIQRIHLFYEKKLAEERMANVEAVGKLQQANDKEIQQLKDTFAAEKKSNEKSFASELQDLKIHLRKTEDLLNSKKQQHQTSITKLKSQYERELGDQAKKSSRDKHQSEIDKVIFKAKARELLNEQNAKIKLQKKLQQERNKLIEFAVMNLDDPSLRQFMSPFRRTPLVGNEDQGKTLRIDSPEKKKDEEQFDARQPIEGPNNSGEAHRSTLSSTRPQKTSCRPDDASWNWKKEDDDDSDKGGSSKDSHTSTNSKHSFLSWSSASKGTSSDRTSGSKSDVHGDSLENNIKLPLSPEFLETLKRLEDLIPLPTALPSTSPALSGMPPFEDVHQPKLPQLPSAGVPGTELVRE